MLKPVTLAVAVLATAAFCRPADLFVKRSLTLSGLTILYRLYIPKNCDTAKKYPLILTYHGVAENGSDDSLQIYNQWRLAEVWAEDSNQARNPCFVLSPQCPEDSLWVRV